MKTFFRNHPSTLGKHIEFANVESCELKTDQSLILRVLCNMIINALEATDVNGVVKVWVEQQHNKLSFCVWNAQPIPPDVAKRIFQRNFSTKAQAGRGVGTYSMKLFGEKILGGKVCFSTSPEQGTVFKYTQGVG